MYISLSTPLPRFTTTFMVGSQDWRRFEIQVPVTANAKFVHAIIGISGYGTARFDDLKRAVMEEVKVADLAEVVRPARPLKSAQLEDKNSQQLAASQMPEIKASTSTNQFQGS